MNLEENMRILNGFAELKSNWNGEFAPAVSKELIDKAKTFLQKLSSQPSVFLTARESIQLEFEKEHGVYLEIELFENRIEVYSVDRQGKEKEYSCSYEDETIFSSVSTFHAENFQ